MASTSEATEIIETKTSTVGCDGGDGALGHPKVFLNLAADGRVDCPYCGRRFVLVQNSGGSGH